MTTHGASRAGDRSPEYSSWCAAKGRCFNPANSAYRNYGARGITMAPEFAASFEAFLAEVGPKPSEKHTIERKDNEHGYVHGNLCWATRAEQLRNRRNNRFTIEDIRTIRAARGSVTQKELADRYGVTAGTISNILSNKIWKELNEKGEINGDP